jgi:two-component system chemotaxis response regulator CheY
MALSVLIIEDDKMLSELIKETLSMFPIFKCVVPAYDGVEALRIISNQKFDIIISDVNIPKKNALEVLKIQKDKLKNDKTKVIIMSGQLTEEDIVVAKSFTNHLLAKPFKVDTLKLKVGELVKQIKEEAEATFGSVPA